MSDTRDPRSDHLTPPSRPGPSAVPGPSVVGDTWQARPAAAGFGAAGPQPAPSAQPAQPTSAVQPAAPPWGAADPSAPTRILPTVAPSTPRPGVPTAPPAVASAATAVEAPASGRGAWGWRALVAFVAGGALTAAGFGLGATAGDDRDVTTASTIPQVVVTPPDLDTEDPAAFVADVLGPSVVQVEHSLGLGSGVVFADGLVMTNNHVIAEADATTLVVRTSDGRVFPATVLGADPRTDIAVVQLDVDAGLPVAALAVGEDIEVGQYAVAIGSPFQLQQTVTAGIVSAVNRPIQTSATVVNAMIQTDTAINPGNSGGALADRQGRVIGINTAIQTDGFSNSNVGVGFAVPIDVAVNVAQRILDGDSLEAGFLGVVGADPTADGASGVIVDEVQAGTAADEAGLQSGDRVISLDGTPVTTIGELAGLVQTRFPGDEVALEVVRGGETLVLTAVLGER